MGGLNASTTKKVVHAVFAAASSASSGTTLYLGNGNKYVAANATEGVHGGLLPVPGLDPYKNYLITKMEVTQGTAPGGSKTVDYTVRTDHVSAFTMADGLDIRNGTGKLTGQIAGASDVTVTAVALIPLAAKDSVTISMTGNGGAAATTVIVVLTIEELC